MNKDEAIRAIQREWAHWAEAMKHGHARIQCHSYAMQDQAATRQHAIHPCMQDDTLAKIGEIGLRVEWLV